MSLVFFNLSFYNDQQPLNYLRPYRAVVQALEVIPRTLAQNCGANVIRTLTALRAKHAGGGVTWGINGETGEIVDMHQLGIWEPLSVKLQVIIELVN